MEELLVGRTLADRYRIDGVIGQGGMSVVYRATDGRLGRPVALKVVRLPHGSSDRAELRGRLRREAASAARIPSNPHVVQVYDHGTDPALDLDFIVMELLRGRDLKGVLREGTPELAEGLRVLRDAARGLAAGHRAGIVHRDVKPANIFLVGDDEVEVVKILDFGIAKALTVTPEDELTQTGHRPLSPGYASPEQLRGERQLTPASDVYQLGLVGYELLTGARPFDEGARQRLAAGERVPLPAAGRWDELPRGVREVLERALAQDPAQRYPDASRLAAALAEAPVEAQRFVPVPTAAAVEMEPTAQAAPEPEETSALPMEAEPETVVPTEMGAGASLPPPARAARRHRPDRWVQATLAAGLAVLGLWGITRLADREEAPAAEQALVQLSSLDEEFRDLHLRAYEAMQEARSDEAGQEAADAVRLAIVDLNQSWVEGDLERHLEHYASRVDFYDAENARRSRIERERGAELERFPRREILIERVAIEFLEPGRARALVEKRWTFRGPEERRTGSGRQEYLLEESDGRWRVVSERMLEVYDRD